MMFKVFNALNDYFFVEIRNLKRKHKGESAKKSLKEKVESFGPEIFLALEFSQKTSLNLRI